MRCGIGPTENAGGSAAHRPASRSGVYLGSHPDPPVLGTLPKTGQIVCYKTRTFVALPIRPAGQVDFSFTIPMFPSIERRPFGRPAGRGTCARLGAHDQ